MLTARGSVAPDAERPRLAAALAAAAVETEMARAGARYTLYRGAPAVLIIATPALADAYTATPGRACPVCRAPRGQSRCPGPGRPSAAPGTPGRGVAGHATPEGDPQLTPDRLLRLAVATSQQAALSSRMELYPRHMAASRAVKLGVGSLLGPRELTVQQIQQRIASRYPQAEPVPGRPALDDLLREAGIAWVWDDTGDSGRGVYRPQYQTPEARSGTSILPRLSTAAPPGEFPSPAAEAAQALEERLARAVHERRFLLLTVAPRYLLRAEEEIRRRFPVTRLSLEALLLQEMRAVATAAGARWDIVLQADAAPSDSRDWRNLQILVRRAMPAVEQALFAADRPVLLVYPGLLARYDQNLHAGDAARDLHATAAPRPRLSGPGAVRRATHHARARRQTRAGDPRLRVDPDSRRLADQRASRPGGVRE